MLALHFDDMDVCQEVTDLYWKSSKEPDGLLHSNVAKRFYYGLASYALAVAGSKRQRRQQYQRGKIMERQLKALAKNGSVNCVHLLQALIAERLAQSGGRRKQVEVKGMVVKQAYDKAISIALRAGFVSDAALIYHRAAIYFQRVGDAEFAMEYTEKSIELYARWEAWSIVHTMCRRYGLTMKSYSSSFSLAGSSTMKRISTDISRSSSRELFR